MFKLKPRLMAPEEDTAAGGPADAPLAPPIDSRPDDDIGDAAIEAEGGADAPPKDEPPKDETPTADDAVKAALDKMAGKDEPEPEAHPTEEIPPEKTPEEQERERLEALHTIPRGLKGEARANYKALSDHAKELAAQQDEQRQQYEKVVERINTFEDIIKDSGATPEVLSEHFQYIKHVTSGNLDAALEFIEGERRALAEALGKPLDGVDLLADFPDLKERVDKMELDEAAAHELANARRAQQRQAAQQEQAQTAAQQRQQVEAMQEQRRQALSDIQAWIDEQSKTMLPPDWQAIEAQIAGYLGSEATQALLTKIPPNEWLPHIKAQYDVLKNFAASRGPSAGGAPTPTPLRPRGAGGKVQREPTNAEEAVEARLAGLRQ